MTSIIQSDKKCFVCGRQTGLDSHHIFGGSYRTASEKLGLKVWLCHDTCHIFGKNAVHQSKQMSDYLKQVGQQKFLETYGDTEEFIKIFGQNFLKE